MQDKEKIDFRPVFNEVYEDERKLEESKAPKWMDVEIKYNKVDISNDSQPKTAKVGDYWSEKQTTEIVNLLKENHDIFSIDYKYLKGLIKEMGEMKIDFVPRAKPMKKGHISLHTSTRRS